MEITELSGQRTQLAIERLCAGDTIAYEGVHFWKDPAGFLLVSSYSEHVLAESSSLSEAEAKIARSKLVLSSLTASAPGFASAIAGLRPRYEFCYDYGQGSVVLASEVNGSVEWRGLSC